jgi:hypothetical protein
MDIAVDFLTDSPVTAPSWLRGRISTTTSLSPPLLSKSFDGTKKDDVFTLGSPGSTNRRFRQRPQNRRRLAESALESAASSTSLLGVHRSCLSVDIHASTEDQLDYALRSADSPWSPLAIAKTDDLRPLGRAHSLKSVVKTQVPAPWAEFRQRALQAPCPGTLPRASRPSPCTSHVSPV